MHTYVCTYYITSARGHELSGHIRADVYNLIFKPYYYAPWPWACTQLCMIREKHVILKAALHTRLAV